jgi:hypothetical protein
VASLLSLRHFPVCSLGLSPIDSQQNAFYSRHNPHNFL